MEANLTLILPTLNERDNVVTQIREVFEALPKIGCIVVVDDNSSDGTVEVVEESFPAQVRKGTIRILRRHRDFGLTPSLQEGVSTCQTKYVGWMDCDGSMPPILIKEMLAKVGSGTDLCIGSRFIAGGRQKALLKADKDSRLEIVLSNVLNRSLRVLLQLPITDFTSGYVIAKTSLIRKIKFRGRHGEYFMDLIAQAHRLGATIEELPYACVNRQHGESKTFGSMKSTALNCFRYGRAVIMVLGGKITRFQPASSGQ